MTISFFLALPLCRPDGQKKAFVRLASDYDALDVANKVSLDFHFMSAYYITFLFLSSLVDWNYLNICSSLTFLFFFAL